MRRFVLVAIAAVLFIGCGQGKKAKAPAPSAREFPSAEIPVMITEPAERVQWLCAHFWDKFTDTQKLYACDSSMVNGVSLDVLETQMGLYATLLQDVPLGAGESAQTAFYNRLDAFQRAFPESNMLPQMAALTTSYLYDPNSPVRSEDLYLPFVQKLASSDLIEDSYRAGYNWDAQKCALNRTGTVAADFTFIDTAGKKHTLHGLKAERLLLIFGNPDCKACKEITQTLDDIPEIGELISSRRLMVVDIYIDEDIELWKSKRDSYPKSWLNGYDPDYVIRGDLIYNVRAVPSMYLLDAGKRVLLKDATTEAVVNALLSPAGL